MTNQPPRHPDDATLFEFTEGSLDAAAMADVSHHVERCAACAGFLAAAARGSELLGAAVEPMPTAAVTRLRLALDDAWTSQHAADPIAVPTSNRRPARPAVSGGRDARPRADRRPTRGPWRRRAIPLLACAVLAILAGTSYVLVDDQGGTSPAPNTHSRPAAAPPNAGLNAPANQAASPSTNQAASPAGKEAANPGTNQGVTQGAAPTAPNGAGPESDIGAAATGTAAPVSPTGPGVATGGAPAPAAPPTAQTAPTNPTNPTNPTAPTAPRVCVAGYDATRLVLPDGRVPLQLIEGPLGIVLLCG